MKPRVMSLVIFTCAVGLLTSNSNIDTLNASVQNIIKAYTKKTKLIVAVNILGNPIELSKLRSFCRSKKIYLMEDNCESMGAKINGKFTGTFGIVNTFSTFFSHHISTIEGGIILTNREDIFKKINYFFC